MLIVSVIGHITLHAQQFRVAENYVFSASTGTYSSINNTGQALVSIAGDDTQQQITLPFTFTYAGQTYTQLKVSSNGYLAFDVGINAAAYGFQVNNAVSNPVVIPWGADLNLSTTNATRRALTQTLGNAPNRVFVVEWVNVAYHPAINGTFNFQVRLYEGSNVVEFVYGNMVVTGTARDMAIGMNAGKVNTNFLLIDPVTRTVRSTVSGDAFSIPSANVNTVTTSSIPSGTTYRFIPATLSPSTTFATLDPVTLYYNATGIGTVTSAWISRSDNAGVTSATFNVLSLLASNDGSSVRFDVPAETFATSAQYQFTIGYANTSYGNQLITLPLRVNPQITSITPTSFTTNSAATLTINGVGFSNTSATIQRIGGSSTSITLVSATNGQITANIPANAISVAGTYTLTVNAREGSSTATFTVAQIVPTITSFTPTTVGVGQTVTITGTNLTQVNGVSFGGVNASSFTVVNDNTVTAVVAQNSASGNVSVTVPGSNASQAGFTFVAPMTVVGGGSVSAGNTLTLTGTNFIQVSTITLGGVSMGFTVVSPTQITIPIAFTFATGGQNLVITSPYSSTSGTITVNAPLASFTITPSSLNVGTINVNESTTLTITVSGTLQTQTVRLTVSDPAIQMASSTNNTFGTSVILTPDGAGTVSGTISVRYAPTTNGTLSTIITIQRAAGTSTVGISGTAVIPAPQMVWSSSELLFGAINVGTLTTQTLQLTTRYLQQPVILTAAPNTSISLDGVAYTTATLTIPATYSVAQTSTITVRPTTTVPLVLTGSLSATTQTITGATLTSAVSISGRVIGLQPDITGFSSTQIVPGRALFIFGNNLSNLTAVRFFGPSGVNATITERASTFAVVTVPNFEAQLNGLVYVENANGSTIATTPLQVVLAPTVSAITPTVIGQNAVFTIVGNNLGFVNSVVVGDQNSTLGVGIVSQSNTALSLRMISNVRGSAVPISIRNVAGQDQTQPIRIFGAPTMTNLSTTALLAGGSLTVTGADVDVSSSAYIDFGIGITGLQSLIRTPQGNDALQLAIAPNARSGIGTLVIENTVGNTRRSGIRVIGAPTITRVAAPNSADYSLAQGVRHPRIANLILTGTDLDVITQVQFFSGGYSENVPIVSRTQTQLIVKFSEDSLQNITGGLRLIGQAGNLTSNFSINPLPAPLVRTITPVLIASTGTLTITGQSFETMNAVNAVPLVPISGEQSYALTISQRTLSTNTATDDQAQIALPISGRIPPSNRGYRLQVVNTGGSAFSRDTFFIVPPITVRTNASSYANGATIRAFVSPFNRVNAVMLVTLSNGTQTRVDTIPPSRYSQTGDSVLFALPFVNTQTEYRVRVRSVVNQTFESASFFTSGAPQVSSMTPRLVMPGDTITITGSNLRLLTSVQFFRGANLTAPIVPNTGTDADTRRQFIVPMNYVIQGRTRDTGLVQINTAGGNDVTPPLIVLRPPTITRMSTTALVPGNLIQIVGVNVRHIDSVILFRRNGPDADIVDRPDEDSVLVRLPTEFPPELTQTTIQEPVVQQNSAAFFFTSRNQQVGGMSPLTLKAGDRIVFESPNVSSVGYVEFRSGANSVTTRNFSSLGRNLLQVTVPYQAPFSRPVTNTPGPEKLFMSARNFRFIDSSQTITRVRQATITGIAPTNVAERDTVTITGTNLSIVNRAILFSITGPEMRILPGGTNERIRVLIPLGTETRTAPIVLITPLGPINTPNVRVYGIPTVRNLQPRDGNPGDTILFLGTDLIDVDRVRFRNNNSTIKGDGTDSIDAIILPVGNPARTNEILPVIVPNNVSARDQFPTFSNARAGAVTQVSFLRRLAPPQRPTVSVATDVNSSQSVFVNGLSSNSVLIRIREGSGGLPERYRIRGTSPRMSSIAIGTEFFGTIARDTITFSFASGGSPLFVGYFPTGSRITFEVRAENLAGFSEWVPLSVELPSSTGELDKPTIQFISYNGAESARRTINPKSGPLWMPYNSQPATISLTPNGGTATHYRIRSRYLPGYTRGLAGYGSYPEQSYLLVSSGYIYGLGKDFYNSKLDGNQDYWQYVEFARFYRNERNYTGVENIGGLSRNRQASIVTSTTRSGNTTTIQVDDRAIFNLLYRAADGLTVWRNTSGIDIVNRIRNYEYFQAEIIMPPLREREADTTFEITHQQAISSNFRLQVPVFQNMRIRGNLRLARQNPQDRNSYVWDTLVVATNYQSDVRRQTGEDRLHELFVRNNLLSYTGAFLFVDNYFTTSFAALTVEAIRKDAQGRIIQRSGEQDIEETRRDFAKPVLLETVKLTGSASLTATIPQRVAISDRLVNGIRAEFYTDADTTTLNFYYDRYDVELYEYQSGNDPAQYRGRLARSFTLRPDENRTGSDPYLRYNTWINNLTQSTKYYFRVRSVLLDGRTSEWVTSRVDSTIGNRPGAPSLLTARPIRSGGSQAVRLSWVQLFGTGGTPQSYRYQIIPSGVDFSDNTPTRETNTLTVDVIVLADNARTAINTNTFYKFRVQAVNQSGRSDWGTSSDFILLDPRVSDSTALVEMYNDLRGTSWTNRTNWLTSNPLEQWEGVRIRNNRVAEIILPSNNMVGTIRTSSLRKLTDMVVLSLWNNRITGFNTSTDNGGTNLSGVTNARIIELDRNRMAGSGSNVFAVDWRTLPSLNVLRLDSNNIGTAIADQIYNTKLTILNLGYNGLTRPANGGSSALTGIGNIATLRGLWLNDNGFTSGMEFSVNNLSSIMSVFAQNNQFNDVADFTSSTRTPNMRHLNIQLNRLSGSNLTKNDALRRRGTSLVDSVTYINAPQRTTLANNVSGDLTEAGFVPIAGLQDAQSMRVTSMRVRAYPLPVRDYVQIEIASPESSTADIVLVDVTGKEIFRTGADLVSNGIITKRLELAGIANGSYRLVVRARFSDGMSNEMMPLVIQR